MGSAGDVKWCTPKLIRRREREGSYVSMGCSKAAEERDPAPPAWWANGSSLGREQNSPEAEGKVLLAFLPTRATTLRSGPPI